MSEIYKTLVGFLPPFDHTIQYWETYKCRIMQWFIANDINLKTDPYGEKRRAILLTALVDGTHKLAADLVWPKRLEILAYADLLTLFDKHFAPKVRGLATQQEGETYAQWAVRLHGLTVNCEFSTVEEALRDRFVMGMLPGPERDKLLKTDLTGLTLIMAREMAENMRANRDKKDAKELRNYDDSMSI